MNLVEYFLRQVPGSLKDMKVTLENMQEMIGKVLQILARINAVAKLDLPISRAPLN